MEMDCNLKKWPYIVEKSSKTAYSLSFPGKLIFPSRCSNSNFMFEKRFFVKYLSHFDENIAKSP